MAAGLRILALLLIVGPACFHACYAETREIPIAMMESGSQPDARQITDYASAVDAVVRVLVKKFGLPVPRYTMVIYSTREEFEAGLIEHLGLDPALARSTASFSQGAIGGHRMLINEVEAAKLSWPERIEFLAHELTHTSQLELASHNSIVRQQWLTEGFAEWIAYAVTESLGLDSMSRQRARIMALLQSAGGAAALPSLAEMNTLAQWIATRRKTSYAATYSHSFLILEYLMKRHSFEAALEYFRKFSNSNDYPANFHSAFGETLEDFEAELAPYLARLLNPAETPSDKTP